MADTKGQVEGPQAEFAVGGPCAVNKQLPGLQLLFLCRRWVSGQLDGHVGLMPTVV